MSTLVTGVKLWLALPDLPQRTTASRVAKALGVTVRTAQRDLRKLRAAGLAGHQGSSGGHPDAWWRLQGAGVTEMRSADGAG